MIATSCRDEPRPAIGAVEGPRLCVLRRTSGASLAASGRRSQSGAVTLVIALLILIAMALVTLIGTRTSLTQHRISGNNVRANSAFAAAEAGAQNALAYANANRGVVASSAASGWLNAGSSPKWTDCANGSTALPCGDGGVNLYDNTWKYYGPLPNQQTLGGSHAVTTWLLSDTVADPALNVPYLGCTNLALNLLLLNGAVLSTVNGILAQATSSLGQTVGLPANLCLPINFSQMPWRTYPDGTNPSVTALASASPSVDPDAEGAAVVQQVMAATSLYASIPPAALMVAGTADLKGDIRIWGNTRPPTVDPMNFSVLNLNDVLGLNVTTILNSYLGGVTTPLANTINLSFAPLLNVSTADVLAFDWNVTFPLSIWSSAGTALGSGVVNDNNSPSLLGSLGNLIDNVVDGLGLGLDINDLVDLGGGVSLLSSARTCLPQFDGTPSSPCTPLSQSLLPNTTNCTLMLLGTCVTSTSTQGAVLSLELPDVQDPVNLVSVVGGLLGNSVPPFPADLFAFVYGYPTAQSSRVQAVAIQQANCSGIGSGALYWVTGDCTLSGTIGSVDSPVTLITTGNVTLAAGTNLHGLLYLRGSSAKTLTGPTSGTRPTIRGAVVSEGAFTGRNEFNLAYDVNVLRKAGWRAGGFAPLPGGWNDVAAGP